MIGPKAKKAVNKMFKTAMEEELLTPHEFQWVFTILDIAVRRKKKNGNDTAGGRMDSENKGV